MLQRNAKHCRVALENPTQIPRVEKCNEINSRLCGTMAAPLHDPPPSVQASAHLHERANRNCLKRIRPSNRLTIFIIENASNEHCILHAQASGGRCKRVEANWICDHLCVCKRPVVTTNTQAEIHWVRRFPNGDAKLQSGEKKTPQHRLGIAANKICPRMNWSMHHNHIKQRACRSRQKALAYEAAGKPKQGC